jgi:hypothetical protein
LKSANPELPYVPGSGTKKVKFVIDHAEVAAGTPRSIREIRINDRSVLMAMQLWVGVLLKSILATRNYLHFG